MHGWMVAWSSTCTMDHIEFPVVVRTGWRGVNIVVILNLMGID